MPGRPTPETGRPKSTAQSNACGGSGPQPRHLGPGRRQGYTDQRDDGVRPGRPMGHSTPRTTSEPAVIHTPWSHMVRGSAQSVGPGMAQRCGQRRGSQRLTA
ncbi:hypothetical protein NDU88_001267 [Pleurodeles waltl]|uniref:Uncharacterized protein n=1 Tax=Pleurodeles waltl TaxID=8319 RepID=A0AAV7KQH9_PLEWA|nr:hypothetical protein NDU88_001267 [Pleurodeles waltl]